MITLQTQVGEVINIKIKISTDKGEKEIEIKLKGRHVKTLWKKYVGAVEAAQKEDAGKFSEYIDFRDNIICELSGLKLEELDNLDIDEKQKVTNAVEEKVRNELTFTKPL